MGGGSGSAIWSFAATERARTAGRCPIRWTGDTRMTARTLCHAGFTVMSQCYCPYQGYKKGAGQELWCVQCFHLMKVNITVSTYMDGWIMGGACCSLSLTWCFYRKCLIWVKTCLPWKSPFRTSTVNNRKKKHGHLLKTSACHSKVNFYLPRSLPASIPWHTPTPGDTRRDASLAFLLLLFMLLKVDGGCQQHSWWVVRGRQGCDSRLREETNGQPESHRYK